MKRISVSIPDCVYQEILDIQSYQNIHKQKTVSISEIVRRKLTYLLLSKELGDTKYELFGD
jgi:hypothetical protein